MRAGPKGDGQAAGLVLVGIASVQCGAALATTLFEEIGPIGTVFLRTLFAAVALALIWRPARPAAADLRSVLVFAAVLTGMNTAFYLSLDRLPLGIAVTIEFLGPLSVAVLGSRRPSDLAFVALAAAGIALLSPGIGNGLDPLGVALALVAALFWGLYIPVAANLGRAAGQTGLATAMLLSAMVLLPAGVAEGNAEFLDPRLLAVGAAVGLLSSAIPYAVELEALKRLRPGTFGVFMSVEPAVAALVGAIALGQGLLPRELIAIAFVMVAAGGALRHSSIAEPEA